VQSKLAATLERIAREGRDAFYLGANAEAVVARLNAGGNPITLDDFASYQPRWYRPLCSTFAGHTVLTAPPPLGGAQVLEMLHLAELRDIAKSGVPSRTPASLVAIADIIRTARVDWSGYNGYPAVNAVPARGLASEAYARERVAASLALSAIHCVAATRGTKMQPPFRRRAIVSGVSRNDGSPRRTHRRGDAQRARCGDDAPVHRRP
jgi:gamma-glutamyltranspeptidase/glutathione hydrolase